VLIGTIFSEWSLVWGAVPLIVVLTGWFWPTRPRAGGEAQ
jgi:cytochrome c oxidase subunit 1